LLQEGTRRKDDSGRGSGKSANLEPARAAAETLAKGQGPRRFTPRAGRSSIAGQTLEEDGPGPRCSGRRNTRKLCLIDGRWGAHEKGAGGRRGTRSATRNVRTCSRRHRVFSERSTCKLSGELNTQATASWDRARNVARDDPDEVLSEAGRGRDDDSHAGSALIARLRGGQGVPTRARAGRRLNTFCKRSRNSRRLRETPCAGRRGVEFSARGVGRISRIGPNRRAAPTGRGANRARRRPRLARRFDRGGLLRAFAGRFRAALPRRNRDVPGGSGKAPWNGRRSTCSFVRKAGGRAAELRGPRGPGGAAQACGNARWRACESRKAEGRGRGGRGRRGPRESCGRRTCLMGTGPSDPRGLGRLGPARAQAAPIARCSPGCSELPGPDVAVVADPTLRRRGGEDRGDCGSVIAD